MTGVFDALDPIIQRIASEVPTFALVDSPSVVTCEEDVLAKLPGCYVYPGPAQAPDILANKQDITIDDQDWIVMIVVNPAKVGGVRAEIIMGQHIRNVIQALNNWLPTGLPAKLKYRPRPAIEYEEGFIMARLRFTHRKAFP